MNRGLRWAAPALALLGVTLCTGCFVGSADFAEEERLITRATGLTLHADTSMHVGSIMLGVARKCAGNDPDAELLKLIDDVDLAIYTLGKDSARRIADAYPAGPEWSAVVRTRDRDGSAQVLVQQDGDHIKRLMVVARDDKELVIVRIRGSLDKLLAKMQSGHASFDIGGHRIGTHHDQ